MLPEKCTVSGPGLQPVGSQEFVQAMGQHASSVCVITTRVGQQRYGLTATAVSSVCTSPPRLLVCVNKSGSTHAKIAEAGRFCVNVISEDQEQIAKCFAGIMGNDLDRFSFGNWHDLATGSPALLDAASAIDCTLVHQIDQFSHSIFIGEVVAVSLRPGKDALLYAARRFRYLRKTVSTEGMGDLESLYF
jgi:flavin reductase (DIM6/NTAB) family NADH-FMN oxidoreductase RutF